MKSNLEGCSHGLSTSSISNLTFGGVLSVSVVGLTSGMMCAPLWLNRTQVVADDLLALAKNQHQLLLEGKNGTSA